MTAPDSQAAPAASNWRIVALLAAFAAAVWLLHSLAGALMPFVFAAALAYICAPAASWLATHGLGRAGASLALVVAVLLLILLFPLVLLPLLVGQLAALAGDLPELVGKGWDWLQDMLPELPDSLDELAIGDLSSKLSLAGSGLDKVGDVLGWFGEGLQSLLSLLGVLVITPLVMFYLLRDWPRFTASATGLLPARSRDAVLDVARIGDSVLGEFFRGQLAVMLIMALVYSALLLVAGAPYALAIGLITGLLCFIPYAGFAIGFVLAMVITATQLDAWLDLLWVAAAMGVGSVVEGFWLTPKIVGDRTGLGPVAVLLALSVMGSLFGFVGIMLAIPAAATLVALWRHYRATLDNAV